MYNTTIIEIFQGFFIKYRIVMYSIVFLIGYLLPDTLVHEMGHLIAALILGVPLNKIRMLL